MLFLVLLPVLALYAVLPGHVDTKRTAFQPDSINSVCMSFKFAHSNPEQVVFVLQNIQNYFKTQNSCPESITPPYRTRLLLPILIGEFSKLGYWWAFMLPNIFIFFGVGLLYYRLITQSSQSDRFPLLLLLLPFLSPHVSWFFANIMTEGFAALFLFGMAFFWLSERRYSIIFTSLSSLLLGAGAIFTKQVWPIVIAVWIVIIWQRAATTRLRLVLSAAAAITGYYLSYLAQVIGGNLYGSDFRPWNQFSVLKHPFSAMHGVVLGLTHDFINSIKFFDPAFFIILYCTYLLFRSKKVSGPIKMFMTVSLLWGFGSVGEVYLADGSYGQNWRFFSFALIFVIPVLLKTGTPIQLPVWVKARK
jgi:hypothetical protein